MKNTAIFLVLVTTLILITVTVMAALGVSFAWVFSLMVAGQVLLVFSVYKVLTDTYKTKKTFSDWYEDHPLDKWRK